MVLDGKIIDKISTGIKARADSARTLIKGEMDEAKSAVDKLFSLKPVQAVNGLVTETVDNVGDFIDEQCEISRKWLSGI